MKDLFIIILTYNLDEKILPPRFLPKVCHKIDGKSMIETCIENCLKLNPKKIMLYVSKNNVQFINKLVKHSNYSKVISYYIFDNDFTKKRKLSVGLKCFKDKNILVVPGNAPLLSTKTLYRMISENKNVKIKDNLFFLQNNSLDKLDFMIEHPVTEFFVPEIEIKQIETKADLDFIENHIKERKKKLKKFSFNKK